MCLCFPTHPIPHPCCTTGMPLPDKPCRTLNSHCCSCAQHSTPLPPKNQTLAQAAPSPTHNAPPSVSRHQCFIFHTPQPQNATPKSPHTLKSTNSINLLSEAGRAPLAWLQLFSVSQDWPKSLQHVYRH